MTDFFDWLTASDSGFASDRLREQFRLSPQEMRRTMEALAPAFLFGLQRLVADPAGWTDFMRRVAALGPDQVAPGLEGFSQAPTGALLGKLFGTDVLTDAVARQASSMAGVAPDTIRKMMPDLALMIVQTMMRMASAQSGLSHPAALPSDAGGQAIAEMMRRSANAVEAFSRPASLPGGHRAPSTQPSYLEQLFADALKGGFPWMMPPPGSASGHETRTAAPDPAGATSPTLAPFFAFAPLLDAFANSNLEPQAEPEIEAKPEPAAPVVDPLAPLSGLMEAGRSMQETYAAEMLALFDRHRPGTG